MQPEFPQVLDSFILIPDTSFQDSSETLPAFVVALEGSEVWTRGASVSFAAVTKQSQLFCYSALL